MKGKFIGDFEGFKRFINPFCRNEVYAITKKDKNKHNKICEFCNRKSNSLEAAHIKGEDRYTIIKYIIDNNFMSDIGSGEYCIDLCKFQDLFRKAHEPINKHFKFICRECHKEYDNELEKVKVITDTIEKNNLLSSNIIDAIEEKKSDKSLITKKSRDLDYISSIEELKIANHFLRNNDSLREIDKNFFNVISQNGAKTKKVLDALGISNMKKGILINRTIDEEIKNSVDKRYVDTLRKIKEYFT